MSWADNTLSDYYCEFCGESFDSDKDFRNHCNSPEHRSVLVSDGGRAWKHRPPPRGVPKDELCICQGHRTYGQCRLGDQCCEAHGDDELEEWRERLDYRRDRVTRAQEKHLEGYQEYASQLLWRYSEAKDPAAMQRIMTESLPGLRLSCQQPLKRTVSSKETQLLWDFELHTITPLQRLVLLRDTFRSHFQLRRVRISVFNYVLPEGCQEWINTLKRSEDKKVLVYLVQVAFQASMYATFVQTLAFDFGGEPVLMRNFSVDTVPPDMLSDIERNRRVILMGHERWSPATVDLVPFAEGRSSSRVRSLFSMYPPPDPEGFQLTQAVMGEELNRDNYRARMHQLLYVEEMARADIVAQFNLQVPLELSDSLSTSSAHATEALYAPSGELFACLRLDAQVSITEDTDAGRLLLQGCTHVWLSPTATAGTGKQADDAAEGGKKRRVYELPIQLTKKDRIYIRLTQECVQEFGLEPRTSFEAEVQFLLDRLPLCEMHYAVEKLPMASLVFPDFSVRPPQCPPEWGLSWDPRLNEQQRRAVSAIVAPRTVPHVPPVLVVGPFGTGKTFTLAQALLEVIRQEPGSRVLICTQSNSAADLYVLDHLDRKVSERPELRPLRILYEYRMPNRVDHRLLQYCLEVPREQLSKQGPWFRQPRVEDIEAHRVVVTTLSSSKMLLDTGIKRGFFTHIFIDEAAQAMETQCILPLALADETTRIVLAGDYMQLNPEVFSVFTRERRLHVSLLERLHDAFPCPARKKGGPEGGEPHPCQVVLGGNYRSHEALVRFASESFYQGRLRALGCPGPHHVLHPLSFFAVRGSDLPRDGSTSYLNTKEVAEVCDVVKHLVEQWSMTWGPPDPSTIAVVTPYYDQVQCIRAELRNRKLSRVRVETVANVQGREFRAVVLSTVRTRATCVPLERAVRFKAGLLNFGFLSDAKLLNTALTRAQSLVVVVGDPVSLCSVGACRTLWEKFVLTCARNGSLYNMRWEEIKYQLDGFELQKEYGLNPHAECFWPKHPFLEQQSTVADTVQPPAAFGYGPPAFSVSAAPNQPGPMPFFSRHIPPPLPGFYIPAVDRRLYGMMQPRMTGPFPAGLFPPGFHPGLGALVYNTYPGQQQAGFVNPQYMQQQQQQQLLHYTQMQQQQQQQRFQMQSQQNQQPQYLQQQSRQPNRHPKAPGQPRAQAPPQPSSAQAAAQASKPLGFNSDPTLSVRHFSGAPASMSASFGNMMLQDDASGRAGSVGGRAARTMGGSASTGAAPQPPLPSRPPNPPGSQAAPSSQPKEQTRLNGLVNRGSFAGKMMAQARQASAPRSQTGEPGIRAQVKPPAAPPVRVQETVWNSTKHGPTSQSNPGTKVTAYVKSVSTDVTQGSSAPNSGQRQVRNIPSINGTAGGLELYNALTRDDTSGDARLARVLRQGFAQAANVSRPSATRQPPSKPVQSYSEALRNGPVK